MIILMNAVSSFFQVLVYLILARAIMSWFVRSPNGSLYKIYMVIIQLTDPILEPCRKLLNRFGMNGSIDFSPILAIIGLQVINGILLNLLRIIFF